MQHAENGSSQPTLAHFFALQLDIRSLEEAVRTASSFHERCKLGQQLADCKGRSAAYKTILEHTRASYRGYEIKRCEKHGYMMSGQRFLGFANNLIEVKRVIDELVTNANALPSENGDVSSPSILSASVPAAK
jgi:hypothetical protein